MFRNIEIKASVIGFSWSFKHKKTESWERVGRYAWRDSGSWREGTLYKNFPMERVHKQK